MDGLRRQHFANIIYPSSDAAPRLNNKWAAARKPALTFILRRPRIVLLAQIYIYICSIDRYVSCICNRFTRYVCISSRNMCTTLPYWWYVKLSPPRGFITQCHRSCGPVAHWLTGPRRSHALPHGERCLFAVWHESIYNVHKCTQLCL